MGERYHLHLIADEQLTVQATIEERQICRLATSMKGHLPRKVPYLGRSRCFRAEFTPNVPRLEHQTIEDSSTRLLKVDEGGQTSKDHCNRSIIATALSVYDCSVHSGL